MSNLKTKPIMNLARIIFYLIFITNSVYGQKTNTSVPKKIDRSSSYLFYLHGKIIEEQGANAFSKEFGKYEYQKILDTLTKAGFVVNSEQRPKNTQSDKYASHVVAQIDSLLKANVAPEKITVVGASKGAWISIIVSSKLKNEKVKFVLMGICDDEYDYSLDMFKICGNILAIYEKSDPLGGSCSKLISRNKDCITRTSEIELNLGNGHGFIFRPYKEWVIPVIEWAKH
jgi:hypothetical protein